MEARHKRLQDVPARSAQEASVDARAARLRLDVRLLGELRVQRAGAPLALPASKRTRALLGYLAATARAHTRAHLCDLLWDGPDDPRAELRWCLTKLRPVVDGVAAPCIAADREHVALQPEAISTDLAPLQPLCGVAPAGIDDAALDAAVDALEGEFLAGLELPACHRFHQWCMTERERWSALRLALLAEQVRRTAAQPERALVAARRWIAADPYAEAAHAALLRSLLALGRARDAQTHWRQAAALFERELGIAPSGALRDAGLLAEREASHRAAARESGARAAEAAPEIDAPGPVDPCARRPAPFVGRRAELRVIDAAVHSLRTPQRRPLLVFVGEPGIGKTRLLDRLADVAAGAGAHVLRARCFEAEMLRPYGAWTDALRELDAEALPDTLRAALAPLRPLADVSAFGRSGDRSRLFEGASAWLRQHAAERPLVLLLDDLQWLDDASAALLHYAVRSADGAVPLLFAAAARDGELDDNAAARSALQSLGQDGRLRTLPIAPLELADIEALLAHASPPAAPAALDAFSAHQASGGNPWFALAAAHASDPSAAGPDAGAWRTLVVEPMQRLDAAHRDVLACAAVMGRECRAELLGEVLEVGEIELAQRLARLERRHLLRAGGDGRHDFVHDLVREAVYRSLTPAQRRAVQRRIVRALERAAALDPGLNGELAQHAIETEQHPIAVRACIAAARHCLRVYANAQALSLAERAAPSLARLPAGNERIAAAIELIELRIVASAASAAFAARVPGWSAELRDAVDAAQAAGLHASASNGMHLLAWLAQQCNDIGATREATLRAELMSRGGDDAARCLQLANTGRCLMEVESDLPRARELVAAAGALAQAQSLQVVELEWARALIARWDGDWDAAQRRMRAAVGIARVREDRWREFECLIWLATVEYERGRWDAVRALGAEVAQAAALVGAGLHAPFGEALGSLAAWAAAAPAAPATALRTALGASLAQLRELDDKAHLAYALNQLAALELEAGRIDAADAAAVEALAAARAVRRVTEIASAQALLARSRREAAAGAACDAGIIDEAPAALLSARARRMIEAAGRRMR